MFLVPFYNINKLSKDFPKTLKLNLGKKYQWEVFLFDERMLRDYYIDPIVQQQYSNLDDYTNMLGSSNYDDVRKYTNIRNHIPGIVEKVPLTPEVEAQISATQDLIEQAKIYANQGIWAETLSLAFSLRESQPQEWQELLASVRLQKYIDKQFQQP